MSDDRKFCVGDPVLVQPAGNHPEWPGTVDAVFGNGSMRIRTSDGINYVTVNIDCVREYRPRKSAFTLATEMVSDALLGGGRGRFNRFELADIGQRLRDGTAIRDALPPTPSAEVFTPTAWRLDVGDVMILSVRQVSKDDGTQWVMEVDIKGLRAVSTRDTDEVGATLDDGEPFDAEDAFHDVARSGLAWIASMRAKLDAAEAELLALRGES